MRDLKSLDIGLNEATLVGAEFNVAEQMASITLSVLTLPEEGPPPEDPRVLMMLRPVGRVAASWRRGRWDNLQARVERFEIEDLHSVVERLGGHAIYGWEFFDVPDEADFASWCDRLSLDWRDDFGQGMSHTLRLFQEVFGGGHPEQHLDLRFWFDELRILRPDYTLVPPEEFAAGGKRWWDAMYSGDPRTKGAGIVPGGDVEPGFIEQALGDSGGEP